MAVIALPKTTDKLEKLGRLQDIPAIRQVGMIAHDVSRFGIHRLTWAGNNLDQPFHARLAMPCD